MDSIQSYTDMNRAHPLITVFRQAMQTFLPKRDVNFAASISKLKESLDKVRADDVCLDPIFENERFWVSEDKAPCTYIEIFENENINMSIFILKPGFKMPLHDHPQMHGLLKVISGTVGIRTFSEIKSPSDIGSFSMLENTNLSMNKSKYNRTLLAQVMEQKICDPESECSILTPEVSNFHEIEALGGPSAFLDILAPPYSASLNDFEPRECKYYRVVRELNESQVQFEEIAPPNWFYCDQAPYLGPRLT